MPNSAAIAGVLFVVLIFILSNLHLGWDIDLVAAGFPDGLYVSDGKLPDPPGAKRLAPGQRIYADRTLYFRDVLLFKLWHSKSAYLENVSPSVVKGNADVEIISIVHANVPLAKGSLEKLTRVGE